MLELFGKTDHARTHCDGYSRRHFLKVGGMAAGGLSLGQLLGIEARAGTGSSGKAIINIYLPGGPSHLDMWDLKPDAPAEIRGEFRPIQTNVAGHRDLRAVSAHGEDDGQVRPRPLAVRLRRRPRLLPVHDRPQEGRSPPRGRLARGGAWVSRLQGPANAAVPPTWR